MLSHFVCLVFIISCNFVIQSKTPNAMQNGALLQLTWKYENPRQLFQKGPSWAKKLGGQLAFTFCFRQTSGGPCVLWHESQNRYKNSKRLKDIVRFSLPTPFPDNLTLGVDIKASWFGFLPILVASFTSPSIALRIRNHAAYFQLERIGQGHRNDDVTLTAKIDLRCDDFFYGSKCDVYCKPVMHRFACSAKGKKICHPGLFGKDCNQRDHCYFERCVEHAKCVNNADGSGYQCICNGGNGTECYPNKNPCLIQPCKNGGICQLTDLHSQSFQCICASMWQGPTCTERRSACEETAHQLYEASNSVSSMPDLNNSAISVCLNGGKCFDNPDRFAFHCICPNEWTGERCEVSKVSTPFTIQQLLLVFGIPLVSFVILLAVIMVAVTVWCRYSKRRKSATKLIDSKSRVTTQYTPGMVRESAPIPVNAQASNPGKRLFTVIGILNNLAHNHSSPNVQNMNEKRESSTYEQCTDDYLEMMPFNPDYYMHSNVPDSHKDEEPQAPPLPKRAA